MATFTKIILSGSTSGRGIKVVQIATAGTTIHTAVAGATDFHEIWLYAVNTSVADVKLTLEYGDPSTDDNIEVTIPAESGLFLIVPGLLLNGGLVVKAFAATANVIIIHGFVNVITS